jgi:hypothetical protein
LSFGFDRLSAEMRRNAFWEGFCLPKRDTQFVARPALIGGKRATAEVAGKGKVGR